MKQYLLSVQLVDDGAPPPSPEEMQPAYQAVAAFNARLRRSGAWVFAGGLHPPSTATVVRVQNGETLITDGPFAEGKEHNAVHSDAASAAGTDWAQIVRLYDRLLAVAPSPVARLNRAVAVAETSGPAAALAGIDDLTLGGYYLFHAIRADLLRRLERDADAVLAYDAAIALAGNTAERAFLQRRRQSLSPAKERPCS
jgi:hypothetical protein